MDLVRSLEMDFVIKASTICQINTPNKALFYKSKGTERIVLDESVNREFGNLKQIVQAYGDKVEVIANSLCHKECVYRMFHYNQTCGGFYDKLDRVNLGYYTTRCALRIFNDVSTIMKLGWIRPEDIKYYTKIGIHYFKLHGREYILNGDPLRAVECYFKAEYDGNLMDLLDMFSSNFKFKFYVYNKKLDGFVRGFYENEGFCKKDCSRCNYCKQYVEKCIDIEKAKWIMEEAQSFDDKFDFE